MEFRFAVHENDLAKIRDIVRDTGYFNPEEVEVAVELAQEALTGGEGSGYHFVIAESERKLVGYSCYGEIPLTTGSYDLYWLVVEKSSQGKGVGRALLEITQKMINEKRGRTLYAETSGKALYESTRTFYRRTGFKELARFPNFYTVGDDKIVYAKELVS